MRRSWDSLILCECVPTRSPISQAPMKYVPQCQAQANEALKHMVGYMTQLVASLKSHQIDCGHGNEIFQNNEQIKRILRGVKIVSGLKPKIIRLPITKDIVIKLVAQCNSSFNGSTMRAAICTAFAGFLRTGEFTYNLWNSSSHQTQVSRGALKFNKDSVTLTLLKSKTDPFGTGILIPMPATGDSTCPCGALKTLLAKYPAPANAPLFTCNNQFGY